MKKIKSYRTAHKLLVDFLEKREQITEALTLLQKFIWKCKSSGMQEKDLKLLRVIETLLVESLLIGSPGKRPTDNPKK